MCGEGAELPEGDPNRKCKGRVVFQGNNVWDTKYDYAIFQDRSSNPATMEAAKAADLVAIFPGNVGEQADAWLRPTRRPSCADGGRGYAFPIASGLQAGRPWGSMRASAPWCP